MGWISPRLLGDYDLGRVGVVVDDGAHCGCRYSMSGSRRGRAQLHEQRIRARLRLEVCDGDLLHLHLRESRSVKKKVDRAEGDEISNTRHLQQPHQTEWHHAHLDFDDKEPTMSADDGPEAPAVIDDRAHSQARDFAHVTRNPEGGDSSNSAEQPPPPVSRRKRLSSVLAGSPFSSSSHKGQSVLPSTTSSISLPADITPPPQRVAIPISAQRPRLGRGVGSADEANSVSLQPAQSSLPNTVSLAADPASRPTLASVKRASHSSSIVQLSLRRMSDDRDPSTSGGDAVDGGPMIQTRSTG